MPAVSTEILPFLTFSASGGPNPGVGEFFDTSSGFITMGAVYAAGRVDYIDITVLRSGSVAADGCGAQWATGSVLGSSQSGGQLFRSNPLVALTPNASTTFRVPNNRNVGVGDQMDLAQLFLNTGTPGGGSGTFTLTSVLVWNDPPPVPVVPFWSNRINCTEI